MDSSFNDKNNLDIKDTTTRYENHDHSQLKPNSEDEKTRYNNIDEQKHIGHSIPLKLSSDIIKAEIISSFTYESDKKIIIIRFNQQKYAGKTCIISSNYCFDDWNKFIDTANRRLNQKRIEKEDIILILDVLDNNYKIISSIWTNDKNLFENNSTENNQKVDINHRVNITTHKIPYTEWKFKLEEKYKNLQNTVNNVLPELWKPLEFALSVKSIQNISDCSLPFIGIILGPPSSVKTLTIELFRGCDHTYFTDNFSAKSFVTHNTSVKRDQLQELDLLPKIKDKLFLTSELSPTFSKKDEELNEILGIITRIADGHGYESDTGAQGHRGYNGEYMFVWLGAAVDIPRKVHRLLGTLGPKLYFYRISNKGQKSDEDYLEKLRDSDNFKKNLNEIKNSVKEYLEWFALYSDSILGLSESDNLNDELVGLNKINWNSERDEKKALECIIKLAKLLAHLRGVVPTWEARDTQGSEYAYTFATIEEPERAMIQLRNLARGHALSQGRSYITMDDIPIVIEVVLSTASRERVIIFDCLLKHKGQLDTIRIKEILHISSPTALRTMTEFIALELVDKIYLGDEENAPIQIQLKQDFNWFLENEFQKLRSSFGKEYVSEYLLEKDLKKSKKQELDQFANLNINTNLENEKNITTHSLHFFDHNPNQDNNRKNDYYPIMVYNKNQLAIKLYETYDTNQPTKL